MNAEKDVALQVASFLGRIESVRQNGASVTLLNEATGESLESQCDLEILRESNLKNGDEFRLDVLRGGNTTSTRISRLPPKPINQQEMEAARKSFEVRWDFSPS